MPYVIHVDTNEASGSDLIRYERLVTEDRDLEDRKVRAWERIAAALEEANKR